ncbi:septum formation protein Maf [candidate division WOR-1 bacterium RIFOXYA12_FULL_52_29]|uniref:dTTP/UTP pyrophosphatase n=1 Tax=candidate division WOR-1 bacterium RIFOXYC12_FULL_54_18 TaxID=1802584 RepID=A0A1F4T7E8_UNCSA|nr:MAG: septum formation protein Maf [candidate division WOR-1 bacterium RIFOXYA2_FULL_51_19]OGC18032.1 MAG: septum formation protein Maf [candidate division WOR-1 bacterium RIFOXYA12_FULL_52_29]OGC26888.1 MAG: septum formation protein Maf [candidate division WOR-1 bacterium RIFOXYB2_FULL_45_9]OGC28449.1 MAG: septum formation protein Maf [candidate division WOR-1 bacterium RIFOXYC12_FULL_54_18]OGC31096.1 MAG: septum formation protein Maf [candidate division WOR-1 bacterium RIFOXYB12_FULL_52_16]
MTKIILASASPRRKELLKKIAPTFEVVVSDVNEEAVVAASPEDFAEKAAIAKAKSVAKKEKGSLIIGADTIVVLGDRILGKPKDNSEAAAMLQGLSGRSHRVITGFAVVNSDSMECRSGYETTIVRMKPVPDKLIADYVATGRPLDKAGAYGIQELEEGFVEKVDGDYDNVIGLPIIRLAGLIKEMER